MAPTRQQYFRLAGVQDEVMKVAFLVRALNVGGAEMQLIVLAAGLAKRGHKVMIITFYPGGALKNDGRLELVERFDLAKAGRWDILRPLCRLAALLRHHEVTHLYSFLQSANILAALVKIFMPMLRVVWGVRASNMLFPFYGAIARLGLRAEIMLGWTASLIICNSRAGAKFYAAHGVKKARLMVIENGIDIDRFDIDPVAGTRIRHELAIAEDDKVIGIVGRIDPVKGHEVALRALARLRDFRGVRIVVVGSGEKTHEARLLALTEQLGISPYVQWVRSHSDMRGVYNAMDLLLSASLSEGFPNVIAEAAACGIPCVATDAGDSAVIVDEPQFVVGVGDEDGIRVAIELALATENRHSWRWRKKIVQRYSAERLIARTEIALQQLGVT